MQGINDKLAAYVDLKGQYSFTPLLTSLQFDFGGTQFGRGLDPSEITGDHGAESKLELQYSTEPKLKFLNEVQYYTFYDAGNELLGNSLMQGGNPRAKTN